MPLNVFYVFRKVVESLNSAQVSVMAHGHGKVKNIRDKVGFRGCSKECNEAVVYEH